MTVAGTFSNAQPPGRSDVAHVSPTYVAGLERDVRFYREEIAKIAAGPTRAIETQAAQLIARVVELEHELDRYRDAQAATGSAVR